MTKNAFSGIPDLISDKKPCTNVKADNARSFAEEIVQLSRKLYNWHACEVSDFGEIFYEFHSFSRGSK